MASLFLLHFATERAFRKERVFRDRTQVLDQLTDKELIQRYRFPRQSILDITELVRRDVERPTQRSHAIPPHIQVLTTLRFLAKDDFQSETADLHGISMSSASRVIDGVLRSVCSRLQNVKFPTDQATLRAIKHSFFLLDNFPNVVGAIDGTLIPIQAPSEDEEVFVCRKGFHAVNVQAICDSDLKFTNVVCKWPGSTHDAFILAQSNIPQIMGSIDGWLLGDSGYPLKKYLMTPLHNPVSHKEKRFNLSHSRTRNTIERAFGVLKSRFRCIHKTGGSLPYKPEKCTLIIGAAFRLHNKCIDDKIPLVCQPDGDLVHVSNGDIYSNTDTSNDAHEIRRRLIDRF